METKNYVNILSFDGGGTRGVMEVFILRDIMRMATFLRDDQESIQDIVLDSSGVSRLEERNQRECLLKKLESVENPIHPTGK